MEDPWQLFLENEEELNESEERNGELMILRYFASESEAQIFSAILTKEDIPNFLSNMFMNQLLPFGQGSIAMHIRMVDRDRAIKILEDFDFNQSVDMDNIDIDLEAGTVRLNDASHNFRTPGIWYIALILFIILVLLIHAFIRTEDGFKFW